MQAADGLRSPDLDDRLAALRRLSSATCGRPQSAVCLGLASDHGLAVGESPAAAVWLACRAGAGIAGLCDSLTTAGTAEFTAGCAIAGLQPVLAVAIEAHDPGLAGLGIIANVAGRPGRIALAGFGLGRPDDAEAQAELSRLRRLRTARVEAAVVRLDAHMRATVGAAGPGWRDVLDLARSGNVSDAHLVHAAQDRIRAIAVERSMPAPDVLRAVTGRPGGSPAAADLFAADGPCHPGEDALPSVAAARAIIAALGGIAAYVVTAAPGSRPAHDLGAWCDRLAAWGMHALAIAQDCPPAGAAAAIAEAGRRGWPVLACGPDAGGAARLGAACALGNQRLTASGAAGHDGLPLADAFARCCAAGQAACAIPG